MCLKYLVIVIKEYRDDSKIVFDLQWDTFQKYSNTWANDHLRIVTTCL